MRSSRMIDHTMLKCPNVPYHVLAVEHKRRSELHVPVAGQIVAPHMGREQDAQKGDGERAHNG